MAVPCWARVITVDDDGLADFSNIQAAINDANDGDEIVIHPGTYTGAGNRDITFQGKRLTVRSTDPNDPNVVAATIIDGQDIPGHRGLTVGLEGEANSVIDGLSVVNFWLDASGAGVACTSGVTIRNCIITGNTTLDGSGGGIRIAGGVVTNCTIKGNYTVGLQEYGPGGGGISCGSNTTVSNCTISENTAECGGGGIGCTFGPLPYNPQIITNCTILGNSAGSGGGISCEWWADAVIRNCTISGNSAGGISCLDSSPTLVNCILWGDSGTWGPEISIYGLYGTFFITISYSDIQGGQAAAFASGGGSLNWGEGNIDADPCFADPCNGDYHLKSQAGTWDPNSESWVTDASTSACIDAGNPGCPLGDESADANNVRINMGAYGGTGEASKTPADWRSIADLTNDWVVDLSDLAVFVDFWLAGGECIPSDLSRNGSVGFVDFSILADEWGW